MQATLVSVAVTLLVAGMGAVWQISALAAKLAETIRQHKDDIDAMRKGLESLAMIPVLQLKVHQIEEIVAKTNSLLPKISSKVDVLESKVVSLREYRTPFRSTPGDQ